MKLLKIGLFLSVYSLQLYSINLEKLRLSCLSVENKLNKNANIKISTKQTCSYCKESTEGKIALSLSPNQQYSLSLDKNHIVSHIKSNDATTFQTAIDPMNEKNILLLSKAPYPIAIPLIDIKLALSEDISLNQLITHLKQEPLSHRKNLRGLEIAHINIEDFYQKLMLTYSKNSSYLHTTPQKNNKIPLTMHKIWFGNHIPLAYKKKIKLWHKKHPDWKIICWTEVLLQEHFPNGLYNQQPFQEAKQKKNYAKMADIARYEIIEKFGGLYADIDFDCLESFTPFHYAYDFYGSLEHPLITSGGCINGLFGAKQHHPILQQCLRTINYYEKHQPSFHYCHSRIEEELDKTWILTGPGLISRSIYEAINRQNNCDIVFPYQYFIPINRRMEKNILPVSCSYHNYNTNSHPEQHWSLVLAQNTKKG